jgi:hypothetical protein
VVAVVEPDAEDLRRVRDRRAEPDRVDVADAGVAGCRGVLECRGQSAEVVTVCLEQPTYRGRGVREELGDVMDAAIEHNSRLQGPVAVVRHKLHARSLVCWCGIDEHLAPGLAPLDVSVRYIGLPAADVARRDRQKRRVSG